MVLSFCWSKISLFQESCWSSSDVGFCSVTTGAVGVESGTFMVNDTSAKVSVSDFGAMKVTWTDVGASETDSSNSIVFSSLSDVRSPKISQRHSTMNNGLNSLPCKRSSNVISLFITESEPSFGMLFALKTLWNMWLKTSCLRNIWKENSVYESLLEDYNYQFNVPSLFRKAVLDAQMVCDEVICLFLQLNSYKHSSDWCFLLRHAIVHYQSADLEYQLVVYCCQWHAYNH